MILSLFSGCGGLDLGFEQAGYNTELAYDFRSSSVASWNANRKGNQVAKIQNINDLKINMLDNDFGKIFEPKGVIGGPPCQSFSVANSDKIPHDPRTRLVNRFFSIALELHARKPLDFIVMENVPGLASRKHRHIIDYQIRRLRTAGFSVGKSIVDAIDFGVPQYRRRFIVVAYNLGRFPGKVWQSPPKSKTLTTVRDAIGHLSEPQFFKRNLEPGLFREHRNHWCMVPKSQKFFDGTLREGGSFGRSFKTLWWDKPSFTVSYGNREVHIHPNGNRRLSVFEGMKLQGFPDSYVLEGNLSEQIRQVSDAVPPPLAKAVALSIKSNLNHFKESTASAA